MLTVHVVTGTAVFVDLDRRFVEQGCVAIFSADFSFSISNGHVSYLPGFRRLDLYFGKFLSKSAHGVRRSF